MKYYTDNNIEVTKRIESKKTFLFTGTSTEEKQKAEEKAKSIGSYVYEVFSDNKNKKRVFVGFGVPK